MIRKLINIIVLLFCNLLVNAQDLKLFNPILISNLTYEIVNNEKVNRVVLDYYNPKVDQMDINYLKYSSDNNTLYLYNTEKNEFKTFLVFDQEGKTISFGNFLGIFRYFNLKQKSANCFLATSTTGNYPSHIEKINSIDILEKNKRFLIIKINYSDIYDFKGYGVLVLQDYKYEK
ncbi:hypothetical protein [Chryseobacterium rhizosphaerae]|uniref:hypothetical protein n=1 Tax=Chryseobacterium rhizosphaerae TaxID=395937 RepID=UPI003D0F0A0D